MEHAPEVPPVRVREAAPADLATVRELVLAAGLPLDGLDDAAHVLVADAGGRIVGTVALERHDDGAGPVFLLRSAAVDGTWRGHGIGGVLVTAALELVDSVHAEVALLTETAADYFPRFGFHPVDRARLPHTLGGSAEFRGACPASAQALLRPLRLPSPGSQRRVLPGALETGVRVTRDHTSGASSPPWTPARAGGPGRTAPDRDR